MLRENTPAYLKDVTFKTERRGKDNEEKRIVVCSFLLQPLTPELAGLIDPDIKAELFKLTTGEPKNNIKAIEFALALPLMMLAFRMAPDSPAASILLRNVKVGPTLKVRKDKESPIYAASLPVNFEYPSADDLLKLAYGINCQHFLTFEKEQGDLADAAADAPPRKPRKRQQELRPGVAEEFDDQGNDTREQPQA